MSLPGTHLITSCVSTSRMWQGPHLFHLHTSPAFSTKINKYLSLNRPQAQISPFISGRSNFFTILDCPLYMLKTSLIQRKQQDIPVTLRMILLPFNGNLNSRILFFCLRCTVLIILGNEKCTSFGHEHMHSSYLLNADPQNTLVCVLKCIT